MSRLNSPFLAIPPVQDKVITSDNVFTDIWKNHFDSISQTLGLVVVHDRLNNADKQETPVTIVIAMSLANRNLLQNAIDGSIIYNTDTKRFNFRENGAWVTFTPVAA